MKKLITLIIVVTIIIWGVVKMGEGINTLVADRTAAVQTLLEKLN
jgi:hypothetical protein